jgi:DNA replication protein DnaC
MQSQMDTFQASQDSSKRYECEKCEDTGFILDGWTARECTCLEQKRLNARLKNAMIPDEFKNAEFDTYVTETPTQRMLFTATREYLECFDEIHNQQANSLGFIAKYGEQRLREIKDSRKRSEVKGKHNNFGLGKTHLQVAAAKQLIKRGYPVFCISDVSFMDELSKARVYNDQGEAVNMIIGSAIQAPVLLWDDIGKAKPSEFRLDMYYQIINERYKAQRPIMFSTNEDAETLPERIGDAAASRLFGMARGRIYAVEGQDYRVKGA